MNFRYVREFYAAVAISKALNERRRPNVTDLETLGLRADQFSQYGRR